MSISLVKKIMMTTAGTALLLSLSGCPFEPVSLGDLHDYNFKLLYDVRPSKDSLNVGDTLWIETEFEDTMTDLKSNSPVNFTNGKFFLPILLNKVQKGTSQIHPDFDAILHNFTYFSFVGKYVLFDEITIRLTPAYVTKKYKSVLAIIPNQPGLYFLQTPNDESASVIVNGKTKTVMMIQDFNVPDIKDYLLGSNYPMLKEFIAPQFGETGKMFYFFYVKEK